MCVLLAVFNSHLIIVGKLRSFLINSFLFVVLANGVLILPSKIKCKILYMYTYCAPSQKFVTYYNFIKKVDENFLQSHIISLLQVSKENISNYHLKEIDLFYQATPLIQKLSEHFLRFS